MLNRGGPANADVLLLRAPGAAPVVVKDFGRRAWPVRRWIAPALLRHEQAMLERLEGLPGLPRPLGRVGSLALALEYVEGSALRRRRHRASLPPAFFDMLDGIVDGLAARGVVHLDLRSPTNVLLTPTGSPALVDLSSVLRVPGAARLGPALARRALAKLRRRFEQVPGAPRPAAEPEGAEIGVGLWRRRLRFVERGVPDDRVPALLLPEAGLPATRFCHLLASAAAAGRRAIAVDLPGFGASSRALRAPDPLRGAESARALLDALRIERVDVVGELWGGLVARALAARYPARVRALVTVDTPTSELTPRFAGRRALAARGGGALRDALLEDLPREIAPLERYIAEWTLDGAGGRAAARAYGRLAVRERPAGAPVLHGVPAPPGPWLALHTSAEPLECPAGARSAHWPDPLGDPHRLWKALGALR